MNDQRRKSLDECSDESERFETGFEEWIAGGGAEATRAQFIAEIADWMQDCAKQGRYIPLASADRRAFRSLLDRWNSRLRERGVYLERIDSLADFDPSAGIVLTGECPYPGLDPYTQTLRGTFFGREAFISTCVAHLQRQGNRILLIIGASGSGKSSVALAGILPRLMEVHKAAWLFGARVTPGVHPLAELAAAVAEAIGRPHEAANIQHGLANEPSEAFGQFAAFCHNKSLLLFIDQFEELLTMCRDGGEQNAFSQVLCGLSDPAKSSNGFSCRILLTLRTDHLARFETNNALKPLHMRLIGENNELYLSAVGFSDIKRAIKVPADTVGLRFIPTAIIDQLASQTAGLSNGLPLLQFALRRLWDTRPRTTSGEPLDLITEEMVNALPDVERALGTVADTVFRRLSSTQQQICERLLLELLVLDENFEEPLRRRRSEAELTHVLQTRLRAPVDVARVIDKFVAAGLLRRFGEKPNSQLEVAHEALLRQWDHIYRLVTGAEVKERLHLVKQIGREAADWVSHEKASDYLSLRGERLVRAISYAADGWLAEAETAAYVDACASRDAEERLREERAKEEKERADVAEKARNIAELRSERFRRRVWQVGASSVFLLTVLVSLGWYYHSSALNDALVDTEVAMYESTAWFYIWRYEKERDTDRARGYARLAANHATDALERDPHSDSAWFSLGTAEHYLGNQKEAAQAFDKVSSHSELYVEAQNSAAAIYFEHLGNEQAAHERLTRAYERAPNNLGVLANYAEYLLSAGRNDDAKAIATKARHHPEADLRGNAHVRVAMSFVLFSTELLSGHHGKALSELDEIDRHVQAAGMEAKVAEASGERPRTWGYKGIRRALERMSQSGSVPQHNALMMILTLVETNGQEGTLDEMRRQLRSASLAKSTL